MKSLLYIFSLTIVSCNNQARESDKITITDTQQVSTSQKTDNSKYFTKQDTLIITTEIGETLKYSKDDFNKIVDNHSEFFGDYPQEPDQAYYCYGGNTEFGSEVGQDTYYALYAYFLKQKNGTDKYIQQRKKLIAIYTNINSLFGHFQYGGTYFGHQHMRILGYAEYSIYLLPKEKKDIEKNYDIAKQKELYLQSIRQLIEDESKIDFTTLGKEKTERNKELNLIVDQLDRLITDNFYLRRAQEFHYRHYEYY
jgi:hypothetical protein